MPLTQNSEETRRLELPTSLPGITPGEWVEIAIVYTSALRRKAYSRSLQANGESDPFVFRQAVLEDIIRSWSDSSPVSPDAISSLSPFVQDWISTRFYELAGRTEEEKKESATPSSLGPDLTAEASPPSWGT